MKEKGKSNPFAGFMRPTEEMLWQSAERAISLESVLPRFNSYTILSFVLFIVLIVVVVALALASAGTPAAIVSMLAVIVALARFWIRFMARGAARGETFGPTLRDHAFYAVTSERLFYERGDDIQAVPLEQVSVINVLPINARYGTLSFGAIFPMWTEIENAEQVKAIIEQAQKERRKALAV